MNMGNEKALSNRTAKIAEVRAAFNRWAGKEYSATAIAAILKAIN